MAKPCYVLCCMALLLGHRASAQVVAHITVKAGAVNRHQTIIQVPFDAEPGKVYRLVSVENGKKVEQNVQQEDGQIAWQLRGDLPAGTERTFELVLLKGKVDAPLSKHQVTYKEEDGGYTISRGDHPVLHYRAAIMEPPAGADTAFRRGGFIHPAFTPQGKSLTNIHPKDHYHHLGIWSPWTDTEFEGKTVDFWNLKKRSGTVRPVSSPQNSLTAGNVFGGFRQMQDHIVIGSPDRTAMTELLEIKVYNTADDHFVWDYNSTLQCASAAPITLNEYRYGGGFAIRGAEEWNNGNSKVLTSEGKDRRQADGSLARWFIVQGALKAGNGGLLVLSCPQNFNAPQPLRVWPENDQGGQVFANFSPTKNKPWPLVPGQTYAQRYRIVTFDGELTAAQAEAYWNDYAFPPEVTVEPVSRPVSRR
ncbi:PmoA family protein [Chitinophaga sp. NPDC101104]|uniref:DUF6807 domain-containing protein n=1 Tax=Chitinophaga sp. NPDC101104 TaxID=3390561 RepID=UPI003D08438E